MIIPAVQDLTIVRGADFDFTFDIDVDGTILDLTSAAVYSQLRVAERRGSTLILDFAVTVSTSNEISLSLTDEQTADIENSKGYYDVLVSDSSGNDDYYLRGKIDIIGTVTVKP